MTPSSKSELRNGRGPRYHPYPANQRFPPDTNAETRDVVLRNQVRRVDDAAVGHREFVFIILLLVLRLIVALILHGNTIRALKANAD
ncbi:hypothetical protein V5O48_004594 [Marasmius crinis-equi]|uniref:Uncharacterized protein n=1 Tax=Marasmius crinis-equi TaxID=585013 RepID=A0ABR3FPQ7_9AGAR